MSADSRLVYLLSEGTREYSGRFADVRVWDAREESLSDLIEGTVDNKAGYGDPEVARKLGDTYRLLQAEGHSVRYERPYRGRAVDLRYVEHDMPEYDHVGYLSQPKLSFGDDTYDSCVSGMDLLQEIVRKIADIQNAISEARSGYGDAEPGDWCLVHPGAVTGALDAMGAVRVEYWRRGHDVSTVRARGRRQRFRDENLLRLFEVESAADRR